MRGHASTACRNGGEQATAKRRWCATCAVLLSLGVLCIGYLRWEKQYALGLVRPGWSRSLVTDRLGPPNARYSPDEFERHVAEEGLTTWSAVGATGETWVYSSGRWRPIAAMPLGVGRHLIVWFG